MRSASFIYFAVLVGVGPLSLSQTSERADSANGAIIGVVRDSASHALALAEVSIVGSSVIVRTDPDGRYSLAHLHSGIYSLRVSYPGYANAVVDSIFVAHLHTPQINFTLRYWEATLADSARQDLSIGIVKMLNTGIWIVSPLDSAINRLAQKYGFRYEHVGYTSVGANFYNSIVESYLSSLNGLDWQTRFTAERDSIFSSYRRRLQPK